MMHLLYHNNFGYNMFVRSEKLYFIANSHAHRIGALKDGYCEGYCENLMNVKALYFSDIKPF
jgi:hypothetical protein